MLTIRKSEDRGIANFGWLNSHHTFSFGQYFDPQHMGWGALRVINEDRVIGGEGFATHSHQDMEIISYVLEGALEHKDSLGTGSVIKPGDVQRMSAGTGISHSEYNHSSTDLVHFLQIWVTPQAQGIAPGYEQKHFTGAEKQNHLKLVGSQNGREGSVQIHQDLNLYAAILDQDKSLTCDLAPDRQGWLQVVRGTVDLNGEVLGAGDGAAIAQLAQLTVTGNSPNSEFLLFDLGA
jgi:redox-sensitive bicupin YhaK (pirin superfamily)